MKSLSLRHPRRLAALLTLCVAGVPVAADAWSTDPTVNSPVCTAYDQQWNPEMIPDGTGGAVVTWHDYRSGSADIYAQRIGADGSMSWTTDGVAVCTQSASQWEPRVASDGAGGAIVAWDDRRSGAAGIYAQRIDSGGGLSWTTDGVVICTATGTQDEQRILADGTGGAFLVWTDDRGLLDIYAQRINATGSTLWATNGVPVCAATNDQYEPQLVSDGAGGVIVTWEDGRGAITVYAQRLDAVGDTLWSANGVALAPAGGSQTAPQILADGSGGAFVTFEDRRSGSTNDVYVQRVDSAGNRLWTSVGLPVCTAAGAQSDPRLVPDGAGGVIIAWYDDRFTSTDIYAQRINASGSGVWAVDGVAVCADTSSQYAPELVPDGQGGAIITWVDRRAGLPDIYAQRIDAAGNVLWAANGVPVASAVDQQKDQRLVADLTGGAIVTWQDHRLGWDQDIYAQRIGPDGSLGATTGVGEAVATGQVPLLRIAPNPFRHSTVVEFGSAERGPVSVRVYDVAGRLVATLVDGQREGGLSAVRWNGMDDSGRRVAAGVYFARLTGPGGERVRRAVLLR